MAWSDMYGLHHSAQRLSNLGRGIVLRYNISVSQNISHCLVINGVAVWIVLPSDTDDTAEILGWPRGIHIWRTINWAKVSVGRRANILFESASPRERTYVAQ